MCDVVRYSRTRVCDVVSSWVIRVELVFTGDIEELLVISTHSMEIQLGEKYLRQTHSEWTYLRNRHNHT